MHFQSVIMYTILLATLFKGQNTVLIIVLEWIIMVDISHCNWIKVCVTDWPAKQIHSIYVM